MRRIFTLVFSIIIFASCSVINKATNEPAIIIETSALNNCIELTAQQIVGENWISEFMQVKNERPTIITSRLINNTSAILATDTIYASLDRELAKTGQLRVIQSTPGQRLLNPIELSKATNIDFVISIAIQPNIENKKQADVELSLWNRKSGTPLLTKRNTIE